MAQTKVFVDINTPAAPGVQDGTTWPTAYADPQVAIDSAILVGGADFDILVAEGTYLPTTGRLPAGSTDARAACFTISSSLGGELALYGGFLGNSATTPSENPQNPDGSFRKTILSGELSPSLNAWTVVGFDKGAGGLPDEIRIDGFLIREGQAVGDGSTIADLDDPRISGGGLYIGAEVVDQVVLANLIVRDNFAVSRGGGLWWETDNSGSSEFMRIAACRFVDNHATTGAGAYFLRGDVAIGNCRWIDNGSLVSSGPTGSAVTTLKGGGIYLAESTRLAAANLLLAGNQAYDGGGAFYQPFATAGGGGTTHAWRNCTISDNRCIYNANPDGTLVSDTAGGVTVEDGTTGAIAREVLFANCILYDNDGWDLYVAGQTGGGVDLEVRHSDIGTFKEDVLPGNYAMLNQISTDPKFVNPSAGNYKLSLDPLSASASSPCIDAGINLDRGADLADIDFDNNISELIEIDLGGFRRLVTTSNPVGLPFGEIVDMGAFETPAAVAGQQ